MKRNAATLTLLSLVVGAIITLGFTRFNTLGRFVGGQACNDKAVINLLLTSQERPIICTAWQRGYPFQFLHSQVTGKTANTSVAGAIWSNPWIEFRLAAADWLIWSTISAGGIGLLVYLLERAGLPTGFVNKKRRQ